MKDQEWLAEILQVKDEEKLTDKQKKIIAAAIEIFSEKGYSASSTSEIAKRAGVAEGTIFRHYKTKKELLISIVGPIMAKLIAPFIIRDVDKVLKKDFDHFEDFLRAMIENRREFIKNNLPVLKILLQEIPFHPELKELFMEHIAKKLYERFKRVVEHFQKKGELIDMPSNSVIRLTASSIVGYLLAKYILLPDARWDDEKEIERTIAFIMHGLGAKQSF
ncbi:TetR/AcrR family transcriptional regulator [Fictibacillus gelatini]|uniref:TetR/AcrR family transcriptional regulator n=1 Tax=Fictibacillus gelatini TaxID=225985 RepID=UPI0004229B96|nr:TetR/AcrR family transcriptional regulator [Fictibacillus gelatini]